MSASWEFPWPGVGVNHQYVHTRRGVRLSDRARAWRDEAILRVRLSGQRAPEGPLCLTLVLVPPKGKTVPDVDGPGKLITDAIAEALVFDDRRIAELHVYRLPPAGAGRVRAELGEARELAGQEV